MTMKPALTTEIPVERMSIEQRIGEQCIFLYNYAKGPSQWQTHYESITGEWEWYFW